MKRRIFVLAATVAVASSILSAQADPPVYEPRVFPGVSSISPAGPCVGESAFEVGPRYDVSSGPYKSCERLKVVFGPIWAKPGQNDVLIQAVTFEKPFYPGYLTRFKPDLVGADGASPRVKDVHLHHGTWLNPNFVVGDQLQGAPVNPTRPYGWGPWIASGEEKTIAVWPKGYGLKILPTDQWEFLHMIHNATPQTFPVWVTYDLDFIPEAAAEAGGIKTTKGIWLDVGDCSWSSQCKKDSFNPIFNIQRGYPIDSAGQTLGASECIFPRSNCASQNTMAGKSAQQGVDIGTTFDEWTIREGGTLTMMGGHLHFGGTRDDVYLLRDLNKGKVDADGKALPADWQSRLIHKSDALYWDYSFPSNFDPFDLSTNVVGGKPTSWDMVMTGVTNDLGWAVDVKVGDKLRIEGVYDSKLATWYEQMGIVMTWLSPGDTSGIDPFDADVSIGEGLNTLAVNPPTAAGYSLPGSDLPACTPSATMLCVRGQATHGRIPTSADHYDCEFNGCPNIAALAKDGPAMTNIPVGGFTYGPAELGVVSTLGVPTVKVNSPVTFWNADTADYMWHTVTRCANPCSGTTSASYPIPDGQYDDLLASTGKTSAELIAERGPDPMDFDSGQMGIGTGANNKLSWTFTPKRTGTFTFFCRIHPSMRGAIRVVS